MRHTPMSPSLNAARRSAELGELEANNPVDLLVIGGGITGTGVALDAASRGLSVVLAEQNDLAHGTSRWSSKLVHGGLRYLASGDIGVAYESAVERATLITRTAPHLTRALAQVIPFFAPTQRRHMMKMRAGCLVGDGLRMAAGTSAGLLPRSRKLSPAQVQNYAPTIRDEGLRGGLAFWDGQLIDDARLVVGMARTAASYGAKILTRCKAQDVTGSGAVLYDSLGQQRYDVDARMVINAAGVWSSEIAANVSLRPSRGTHLVIPQAAMGGLSGGLTVPVPGQVNRFVFALPTEDRIFIGLTDEESAGPIPDVPQASEDEIDFLLNTINAALKQRLSRDDLIGTYSGLRPLLNTRKGQTADVSRKHKVIVGKDGLVTIVGGKLTTYRHMAQVALNAALKRSGCNAGRCRTTTLPLVGAANRASLARIDAPARLVSRYGVEALQLIAESAHNPQLAEPIAPGITTTMAELMFAVRHELALDESDLLDRRTRIGLSAVDRERALPAAKEAFQSAASL